jgi:hypothetical protein
VGAVMAVLYQIKKLFLMYESKLYFKMEVKNTQDTEADMLHWQSEKETPQH